MRKQAAVRNAGGESVRHARLKIGEVARRSGVGVEALRFYERQGLLGRPERTGSGYRLYDESVLDRLDFIKRAQALGFSLSEISSIVAESRDGTSPCAHVREMVRTRLQELDERLAELVRYRAQLAETLREWDESGDRPGHVCGLIEESTVEGPAPQTAPVPRRRP